MAVDEVREWMQLLWRPPGTLLRRAMHVVVIAERLREAHARRLLPLERRQAEITLIAGARPDLERGRHAQHLLDMAEAREAVEIRQPAHNAGRATEVADLPAEFGIARVRQVAWDVAIVIVVRLVQRIHQHLV